MQIFIIFRVPFQLDMVWVRERFSPLGTVVSIFNEIEK